jgi:hypothetical protein
MLKRLFFAIAVLLPIAATAQVYPDDPDPYVYSDYRDDGSISIDKHFLTPAERGEAAILQAMAEKRFGQWLAQLQAKSKKAAERKAIQAEREAAWRAQCTVPWLGLGCPSKEGS